MSNLVIIDRSVPFNPETFIGQGWSIEEQDERAIALPKINLNKVILYSTLKRDEQCIKGEENIKRLKAADFIRLDAGIFKTFWENQTLIPGEWKEKMYGHRIFIFFEGTILRSPEGDRYCLQLNWGGKWYWDYAPLKLNHHFDCLSAVLE